MHLTPFILPLVVLVVAAAATARAAPPLPLELQARAMNEMPHRTSSHILSDVHMDHLRRREALLRLARDLMRDHIQGRYADQSTAVHARVAQLTMQAYRANMAMRDVIREIEAMAAAELQAAEHPPHQH